MHELDKATTSRSADFISKEKTITLDISNAIKQYSVVIKSFSSTETEKIWKGEFSKKIPTEIQRQIRKKLRMINNAEVLEDLRVPPGNKLEPLKGDRKGQYSIRVNDQWRICFNWISENAISVEVVDYH